MRISVSDAKGQLTELVRRAEQGDDIVLTRHGQAVARVVPIRTVPDRAARRKLLEAAQASGARKARRGPTAARSQDFLYDKNGLPK
ncbi:MAG TPA: type II toxin-antitoxin system prevent-host-death family antitoxin [Rhizomicrobium sp.]|nr:type II toxin-antitoxin system prevent-host-death family antitoxin [Rhizomicrobium sp.]